MKRAVLAGAFAAALGLGLGLPGLVRGQERGDGPTSLVITYLARAESRAAFRSWMDRKGVPRFEAWSKSGLFRSYQVLFSSFAASGPSDAIVILNFARYSEMAAWQEVEKSMPGGLPPEALAMAAPTNEALADVLTQADAAERDPAKAAYVVTEYDVLTDPAHYRKYSLGYVVPQMKGWMAEGILSAYTLYLNQNPPGAPWSAMLVLEYRDSASLARREVVKTRVREHLAANDADWKAFSNDKTAIRKEKAVILAAAVMPAAR